MKSNLYNKYRPKNFAQFIGQELVKHLLLQTFKKNKILQSFMLYGPPGVGKTSMARIFAKACNCEKFQELGDVCNECSSCKAIENSSTVDFAEIDAASYSGVDHVREIISNSHYMPLDLKKKIYIMDECHNFSQSAWNALLKTIEEPFSENVIFIFLTTNIHKIPETILTRCQKYCFNKLTDNQLYELMDVVSSGESKFISSRVKNLLISLSNGSARECVTLMEQLFLSSQNQSIEFSEAEKTFSLSNRDDLINFFDLLSNKSFSELIEKIDAVIDSDKHLLNYLSSLLNICLEIHIFQLTSNFQSLRILSEEEASKYSSKKLPCLEWASILERAISTYNSSFSKKQWLTICVLKLIEIFNSEPPKPVISSSSPTFSVSSSTPDPKISIPTPIQSKLPKKSSDTQKLLGKIVEAFSIAKPDIPLSEKNYVRYEKFIQSPKADPHLISLLKKSIFVKNAKSDKSFLLTIDKLIIVLFENEDLALEFNDFLLNNPESKDFLHISFFDDKEWIAISKKQFNECKPKLKNQPEQEKENSVDSKQSRFDKVLEILDSKI